MSKTKITNLTINVNVYPQNKQTKEQTQPQPSNNLFPIAAGIVARKLVDQFGEILKNYESKVKPEPEPTNIPNPEDSPSEKQE